MKKVILFCGALLAMTAAVASAQINLAINDCGSGISDATWLCNTNSGVAFQATASVFAPPLQTLTGEEGVVEISFANPVPAWWRTGTGNCRALTAIGVAFVAPASGGCVDYFGAVGAGPSGGSFFTFGPGSDPKGPVDANRLRIRTVSAVDAIAAETTPPPAVGDDVFLFTITVNRTRSTGTGACVGCTEPACAVFKELRLTQPAGVGDPFFTVPASYGFVTLQGGVGTDCPRATPASRSSWGQVKSLYR